MSKCTDNPKYDSQGSDVQNTWKATNRENYITTQSTKNIFLLPTPKPSKLFIIDKSKMFKPEAPYLSFASMGGKVCKIEDSELYQPQNIYITSEETLKDGDWWISRGNSFIGWVNIEDSKKLHYKKIILTNDQDLIDDGVQKIDDDFLRWFVNNSGCEFVEVDRVLVSPMGREVDPMNLSQNQSDCKWKYKTNAPKKNFYCGDEVDYGEKCEFQCEGCNDATGVDYGFLPQEKVEHKGNVLTTEEVMKEDSLIDDYYIGSDILDECSKPKQETLEEASETIKEQSFNCLSLSKSIDYVTVAYREKAAFIKGAEWRKEKNKTDLDYNTGYYDGIKVRSQWQQERSYTEEDLLDLLIFIEVPKKKSHIKEIESVLKSWISRKKETKTE